MLERGNLGNLLSYCAQTPSAPNHNGALLGRAVLELDNHALLVDLDVYYFLVRLHPPFCIRQMAVKRLRELATFVARDRVLEAVDEKTGNHFISLFADQRRAVAYHCKTIPE